jgi:hypothetical protein
MDRIKYVGLDYVGLEPSHLIPLLARIQHHFATSSEEINSCSGSPIVLITSSEIAKTALIGTSAVQRQYIFEPTTCRPHQIARAMAGTEIAHGIT